MRDRFFLLLILAVIFVTPSFSRDAFYPDETRYLFIASSLKGGRDFFFLPYGDEVYFDKPPLYFWLLYPLIRLFGHYALTGAMLINVIAVFVILVINRKFIESAGDKDIVSLANLFIVAESIFLFGASIVRMDLLFVLFIFLAFYYMYVSAHSGKRKDYLFFSLFIFLSVITKGFLGMLYIFLVGITVLGKDRKKLFRFLTYFFLAGLVVSFCIVTLGVLYKYWYKGDYSAKLLSEQIITRVLSPVSHKETWWFYLPRLLFFFPSVIFFFGYLFRATSHRKRKDWEKIYLWWFFWGIITPSIIKTKLDIYLLTLSIPIGSLGAVVFKYVREKIVLIKGVIITTLFIFVLGWLWFYNYIPSEIRIYTFHLVLTLAIFALTATFQKTSLRAVKIFLYGWIFIFMLGNITISPEMSKIYGLKDAVKKIKQYKNNVGNIFVTDQDLLAIKLYGLDNVKIKEKDFPKNSLIVSTDLINEGVKNIYKNKRIYVYLR